MTTVAAKFITAAELLKMGDIGRCELIYGELVMMSPAGAEHGVVAMRAGQLLSEFVTRESLGVVFAAETGFRIASDPDLVRAPDVSFVRRERVTPAGVPRGYFEGVPDLAVEVISPADTRREVAEKVNMWLAHGTRVVWVADPTQMSVDIHRIGTPVVHLSMDEEIRDEPLLPGFTLPLRRVFLLS